MRKILLLSILLTINCTIFPSGIDGNIYIVEDGSVAQQQDNGITVDIFPNPVTDGRLTIRASQPIHSIQALNITGKIVFSQEYSPGNLSAVIDINDLEHGIYLVRVIFDNKSIHTEKVMVK